MAYFGLKGKALSTVQVILIVAPAFILFGYNQAGLGGLITLSDWSKTFPEIDTINTTGSEKSKNSTLQGFVVAVFTIGALFGALSCSRAGDHFGRRHVIFCGGVFTLVGEILECSAFSLAQLIVGRIILGFGVGQLSAIVPVWQSETSGAKNRGRHVVLDGLFICTGYVLENWINLGFWEFKSGPITWRPPIAIAIFFSLVLMASIYFLPESPRWLLLKNKKEKATQVTSILRNSSPESIEVQAEVAGIEYSLEQSGKNGQLRMRDMFTMGKEKLFYRTCLCLLLQFFQQMSGSNLISAYAPILFQNNLGLGHEISRILSGGALTLKLVFSFVGFLVIDRFGRRVVFMVSGAGMSVCLTALAVATSFPQDNTSAQIAAAYFIYMFNIFVPIGFSGAHFLYTTEVAPIRLRMAMSSVSVANHWMWNFLVLMVTPVAIDTIGWRYYIIYIVIAACIPVTVYFLYPETMGLNLEDIDHMFKESPSVLKTVKFAKNYGAWSSPTSTDDGGIKGAVEEEHLEKR